MEVRKTRLICPNCMNIQTKYRKASRLKKYGHLKRLWCYKCKKIVNHIELCNEEIEEIKR